jgi:hypothetical protein
MRLRDDEITASEPFSIFWKMATNILFEISAFEQKLWLRDCEKGLF